MLLALRNSVTAADQLYEFLLSSVVFRLLLEALHLESADLLIELFDLRR